ncbi:MAG TPA: hypothetical protein VEX41_06770 [Candidatus Eisenbacteria bacterium]|nr:hypothetical protein [Candidatus Eisenbacteria bacterium]
MEAPTSTDDRSDLRVRLALLVGLLLVLQPGGPTSVALLAMAVLLATLVASLEWRIERVALVVLLGVGLALRIAIKDQVGSDVLDVVAAAIDRTLGGENPYGVGYDASNPPGAPYPYGPLALLWYLPFADRPRVVELLVSAAILTALAIRGRFLGLAVYATAPVLVSLTSDGSNDTSAGLLILAALLAAGRRPVLGGILLAVAVAFKPYALAWAPGLLWWGGGAAATGFLVASVVAWAPVLLVWGPGSFLRSVQMADAAHLAPYYSFGAIWEGVLKQPAPVELLDRFKLVLGALTAGIGLRFATSIDRVIVVGIIVFLVTLYAGYWATFAYVAAIAPIVCWRLDDWFGLGTRPLVEIDLLATGRSRARHDFVQPLAGVVEGLASAPGGARVSSPR